VNASAAERIAGRARRARDVRIMIVLAFIATGYHAEMGFGVRGFAEKPALHSAANVWARNLERPRKAALLGVGCDRHKSSGLLNLRLRPSQAGG